MELSYSLLEEKGDFVFHIFKGCYFSRDRAFLEKYSLCGNIQQDMVNKAVIESQDQETMVMLCRKNKRNICQTCLSKLK